MKLSVDDARYILEAQKLMRRPLGWDVAGGNRLGCVKRVKFECRVTVAAAMPRGLWFRITTIPQYPEMATFQLECDDANSREHLPLFRLDWRPLGFHRNGPHGPPELRNLVIPDGVSHVHRCLDHKDEESGTIRDGGVQTARVIEPDFTSYDEALRWTCDELRIKNWRDIPPPPTQGELSI